MAAASYHYYAFDAAQLLETCIEHLQDVVELDTKGSHSIFYELKEGLLLIESMLQEYFMQVIREDSAETPDKETTQSQSRSKEQKIPSLTQCMSALRTSMEQKREKDQSKASSSSDRHHRFTKSPARQIQTSATSRATGHTYSSSRNVTDTLLFRLIVALQLCLVRIDDAHFVIANCRRQGNKADTERTHRKRRQRKLMVNIGYCGGILGVTAFLLRKRDTGNNLMETKDAIQTLAKVGAVAFLGRMTLRTWKTLWMTSKLDKTIVEITEWRQQWVLVHSDGSATKNSSNSLAQLYSTETGDASKAERLMEYARRRNPINKVCISKRCYCGTV